MTTEKNREIHLKSRPQGTPQLSDFDCVETDIPAIGEGDILIRNAFMSVDPYMRGRMIERESYIPPFQIGAVLEGGAVGDVVASKADGFAVGDRVSHMKGWRTHAVCNAAECTKLPQGNEIPIQTFLGVMGMPGLTAYAGLLRVGALKEGETVLVSAASGAVGALVCQIAKLKNCTVIGTAGSDEKCSWLEDTAHIDKAINYKSCGNLTAAIAAAAPKGVDVYFENVGGDHLQAAIDVMRPFGRLAICGMIAQYNDETPRPGPNNLIQIVGKNLRMEGFIVSNHADMRDDFFRDMTQWITQGKIKWQETILDGVEQAPQAFMNLFSGDNFGKMLVRLA